MIDAELGIAGASIVRRPTVAERLEGAVPVGPYSSACPGALLRVVPGVGRFLARGGTTLEYCTEPGAPEDVVEALLQGGVLGALIHQRGELPLHATTIVSPDGLAVALAGDSGAGKSTTAFEFVRRGWTLLSDDLTRVTVEEGEALAWPGRSRLRLVADACERFGLDTSGLAAAPNWPGKHVVELPRWPRPIPLRAVVVLGRTAGATSIEALRGAAAVRALGDQTYRLHYVEALGQAQRHFALVAATARRAAVMRTRGSGSVERVADTIISAAAGH